METLLQKNILQSKRVGSDYQRNTIFYGVVGILFAGFGISQLQWLGLVPGGMPRPCTRQS